MERYFCIHCHFYQPPRENPWLEAVEAQDSAYPYHDWNERITAECYSANAFSRILAGDGRIEGVVNNYSRISFNFGSTLLSWMEEKAPEAYRAILEGDRESRTIFSGHGSALAQGYNHVILPLANSRDKKTQVLWGIRDFMHRFDRPPEGLWLPETAVDLETLEILAMQGIRFAILAPHQAARVRRRGSRAWRETGDESIDPSIPYELRLRSGRRIALFFYDGPISRGVAFEGLLENGEFLANRILGAFSEDHSPARQLVHIATDGETYGHHHAHGEMALSYALRTLGERGGAVITNYGEHLERFPPDHEAQIVENSSWSCAHGIERWRSDCGCSSGKRPGWSQKWRGPLREALDWLRDSVARAFETEGGKLFRNPWTARDDYISVILDRSDSSIDAFLRRHAAVKMSPAKRVHALKLMEIQRHAMLMYTSCGWFFDDISGIETVQVLQYAGRVIQLFGDLFGGPVENSFLERLERAESNVPEHGNGRAIYMKFVKPAMVDLHKAGAHYAVSSLFENYGDRTKIFCYDVDRQDFRVLSAGKMRLAMGRATITSEITRESSVATFGVLHLGDHNVSGGIREYRGEEAYQALIREITDVFGGADLPGLIRAVDRNFGLGTYSLKLLFRDEQRKIVDTILGQALSDALASYRHVYGQCAPLIRFLIEMGHPLPGPLRAAAEHAMNAELRLAVSADKFDTVLINGLIEESARIGISLDSAGLGFAFQKRVVAIAEAFREKPDDPDLLHGLDAAVDIGRTLPFEIPLWRPQNIYFEMMKSVYPAFLARSGEGDESSKAWVGHFRAIGEKLSIIVPGD